MAGGTPTHAMIGTNTALALGRALEASNCFVQIQGLRIEADPGRKYVYPDATVIYGEMNFSKMDPSAATNPTVSIEVLSPSTSDFDRGGKRNHYMAMQSVQEYVLIEQSEPKVETFIRQSATDWMFRQITGLDATLELSALSVPVSIPLGGNLPPGKLS